MARVLFKIPPLSYALLVRKLSWRAYYSRFPLLVMLSWYGNYHGARTIQDSPSYLSSLGTGIIMARVLFEIPSLTYALLVRGLSWRAYYSRFPLLLMLFWYGNYHGARTIQDSHSWRVLFEIPTHGARTIRDSLSYLCSLGRELSWRAYYSRFPLMARVLFEIPTHTRVLFEIPTHGARTIRDSHSWRAYYSRFPLMARVLFEIPSLTYALLVGNYHGARTIRDSHSWHAYYSRFPLMARVLLKIPTLTYALLVGNYHGARTTQDSHSWRTYYSRFPLMARVLFEIPTHARVLFEIPTHGARTIRDSLSYLCSLGREL